MILILENYAMLEGKYKGMIGDVRLSNTASLSFFYDKEYKRSDVLSKPDGYGHGNTYEDFYKVVLYKKFPCEPHK